MEETSKGINVPGLGDRFPDITVNTTHGKIHLPDDYNGKWFVLFSHPGDFTPVCTTEFIAFSKKADKFKALNAELVGLSVDQVQSHLKWAEWINDNAGVKVPFPIIADELGILAKKLGMLHESKGTNTVRAVFIVDPKGLLRIMLYYPQEVGRNVDEVLRALYALQISDKNKVAAPENFPNNEYLGKNMVIIPPAASEAQVEERKAAVAKGDYKMKDWWLCYREL